MKINLICASKIKKESPLYDIYFEYFKRITLFKINLIEFDEKNLSKENINKTLFSHIKEGTYTIALDENGKNPNSQDFAKILANYPHQNINTINFIIAGAEGFLPQYKSQANELLSLSKFTFPHQLARVLLIEQLYRCQCLINGHPYHK